MHTAIKALGIWVLAVLGLIGTATTIDWLWPKTPVTIDETIVDLVRTLSWPVVLLVSVALIVTSKPLREALSDLASRIQNAKVSGIEVGFGPAKARETKTSFEQPLQKLMGLADLAYRDAASAHSIKNLVSDVLTNLVAASKAQGLPSASGVDARAVRATVHVRDVVIEQSLYQLIDYQPAGSGAGRRYSVRYGAIGLAWRLGERQVWNGHDSSNDLRELMRNWGMTAEEAAIAMNRPFATCLPLKNGSGSICGVLYIDVADIKAVTSAGNEQDQNRDIKLLLDGLMASDGGKQAVASLGVAVGNVSDGLEKSGTFIKIYG